MRDALSRAVMRYGFAMLGGQLTRAGMDAGGGQVLPDVLGKPVYTRNSREFAARTEYDALRRPVRVRLAGPGINGVRCRRAPSTASRCQTRRRGTCGPGWSGSSTEPGSHATRPTTSRETCCGSTRQLADVYTDGVVDWSSDVPLDPASASATSYDALNRPISITTPDGSILLPSYDPASRLDRLDGHLRGAAETTPFAEQIQYNARGQRTVIRYGNGTSTAYSYDPLTFRLIRLPTLRGSRRLQDLKYTYDAVGNPTRIADHAQQDRFFRNHLVSPTAVTSTTPFTG